jgi:hypothetical protein
MIMEALVNLRLLFIYTADKDFSYIFQKITSRKKTFFAVKTSLTSL